MAADLHLRAGAGAAPLGARGRRCRPGGGLRRRELSAGTRGSGRLSPGPPWRLIYIFAREPERRRSVLADAAVGLVAGFGAESYRLGLEGLVGFLQARHGG